MVYFKIKLGSVNQLSSALLFGIFYTRKIMKFDDCYLNSLYESKFLFSKDGRVVRTVEKQEKQSGKKETEVVYS